MALRGANHQEQIWNYFRDRGWSEEATAAIMGNMAQEATPSLKPDMKQKGGPGRGLAQWEVGSDRWATLNKLAREMGKSWSDLEVQLVMYEREFMDGNRSGMRYKGHKYADHKIQSTSLADLKSSTNIAQATVDISEGYHRPGKPHDDKRINYANQFYQRFTGKATSPTASAAGSSGGGSGGGSRTGTGYREVDPSTVPTTRNELIKFMRDEYAATGDVKSVTELSKNYLSKLDEGQDTGALTRDEISYIVDNRGGEPPKKVKIKSIYDDQDDTINQGFDNIYMDKDPDQRIMGLPFRYNELTDPGRRVYSRTLMSDAPLVTIVPGSPKFSKERELKSYLEDENVTENELINRLKDAVGSVSKLINGYSTFPDLRYYSFEEQTADFLKHFQTMATIVKVKMDLGKQHMNMGRELEGTFKERGIQFYALNSTSHTESLDNSYGDSAIKDTINGISQMAREVSFLTGLSTNDADTQEFSEATLTTYDQADVNNIFSGLADAFMGGLGFIKNAAISGSNINFPMIWQDSSFSRSYNLEFKFTSPYATMASIYNHVYIPFLLLLTLTLPKMDSMLGYYAPYIVRVDMPGKFVCDMGVVTSMSWSKGGDDNLYQTTSMVDGDEMRGLPTEMTVSITVQDLYPVMAMHQEYGVVAHNVGLHAFLDNMAGLEIDRFTPIRDMTRNIKINIMDNVLGRKDHLGRSTRQTFRRTLRNAFNPNPY